MPNPSAPRDPVSSVALLGEPNRRKLYEFVAARDAPVGREEAASSLRMSRELAAFHLDRLVAGGLLQTEYRRLGARRGPGAGRPAKLYRRADQELSVSFPPRDYERAAEVFADALSHQKDGQGLESVADIARSRGQEAAGEARRQAGPRPSHRRLEAALVGLLRESGYEPEVDQESGAVRLRNCPYHLLATTHRDLTCGMNLAWAQGIVDGLRDASLHATSAPAPGYCCVMFKRGSSDNPSPATSTGPEPEG